MSTYTATIRWHRTGDGDFAKGQYSRAHEWAFDGGADGPGSPEPAYRAGALVGRARRRSGGGVRRLAVILPHAVLRRLRAPRRASSIDTYVDEAEGVLEKRADGKMAMTRVTLRPRITWGGEWPDAAVIADLHHKAHEACFIANSVNTEVTIEQ